MSFLFERRKSHPRAAEIEMIGHCLTLIKDVFRFDLCQHDKIAFARRAGEILLSGLPKEVASVSIGSSISVLRSPRYRATALHWHLGHVQRYAQDGAQRLGKSWDPIFPYQI
jgi:hypothetical protein